MVRGLILSLCITAVGISGADAQQNPSSNNPKIARIQQLRQEMIGLRKQMEPIYLQIQQLMAQVTTLRERIRPIVEKMDSDRAQIEYLAKKHGKN